jgi:hypothetical protein
MREKIATERPNNGFMHRITVEEDHVSIGDYIFDFTNHNAGVNCVLRCDTEFFTELVNKELKKPLVERRAAKIIASDDPVLNANGIPGL